MSNLKKSGIILISIGIILLIIGIVLFFATSVGYGGSIVIISIIINIIGLTLATYKKH